MLSDEEAVAMVTWVRSANSWSLAAQAIVQTSTALATESRDLADRFDGDAHPGEEILGPQLRVLAEAVENDTRELRDRYLATSATLEDFSDLLD